MPTYDIAGIRLHLDGLPALDERYVHYGVQRSGEGTVRVRMGADPGLEARALLRRGGAWLTEVGRPVTELAIGGEGSVPDVDRLLMHGLAGLLAERGGLLAHAAAVDGPHGAIAFLGPSGAGKTTAAGNCPVPRLHPDRVALGIDESGPWLAPVPFLYAEPSEGSTGRRPLARLLFVAHASANRVRALPAADRTRRMLESVLMPPDPDRASGVLALVAALSAQVRVDVLEARLDGGFWPLITAQDHSIARIEEAD